VVAETWDGWLNDMDAFPITAGHVIEALENARPGGILEGNVGGGTGMICHDFKGGIGTASRLVVVPSGEYTVGVLVQANHGDRRDFRVDGVPVGLALDYARVPNPYEETRPDTSSIIIVVATDAPLLPGQCRRLAKRAALGMGRVGGIGHNGSGDLFLAFATGNHFPAGHETLYELKMVPQHHMNELFEAVIESVEEAILNALTAAETMVGYRGHIASALPIDELLRLVKSA
jgi:D-aminopeptidase